VRRIGAILDDQMPLVQGDIAKKSGLRRSIRLVVGSLVGGAGIPQNLRDCYVLVASGLRRRRTRRNRTGPKNPILNSRFLRVESTQQPTTITEFKLDLEDLSPFLVELHGILLKRFLLAVL